MGMCTVAQQRHNTAQYISLYVAKRTSSNDSSSLHFFSCGSQVIDILSSGHFSGTQILQYKPCHCFVPFFATFLAS